MVGINLKKCKRGVTEEVTQMLEKSFQLFFIDGTTADLKVRDTTIRFEDRLIIKTSESFLQRWIRDGLFIKTPDQDTTLNMSYVCAYRIVGIKKINVKIIVDKKGIWPFYEYCWKQQVIED